MQVIAPRMPSLSQVGFDLSEFVIFNYSFVLLHSDIKYPR